MLEEQPISNNQTLDASSNQPSSNLLEPFQTDSKEFSPNLMMNSASETLTDIGENEEHYTAENILDVGNIFNQVISSTSNTVAGLANDSDIDEITGTSSTEIELVNLKNENDFASLVIDGKELLIEQNFSKNPISSSVPFTKKNGWTNNNDHPRTLADVNGDYSRYRRFW